MKQAALFAFVGAAFLAHWVVADPSYEGSASQSEWAYVLFFSGVILLLALAVPLLARPVDGRLATRVSLVVAAGASLGSIANIFEDGLQVGWVFFVFVLGSAIMLLGLLALTIVIVLTGRGSQRLLAFVPAGTLAAIVLYVPAGGPLMLASWVIAATLALALPARATALATSATP